MKNLCSIILSLLLLLNQGSFTVALAQEDVLEENFPLLEDITFQNFEALDTVVPDDVFYSSNEDQNEETSLFVEIEKIENREVELV